MTATVLHIHHTDMETFAAALAPTVAMLQSLTERIEVMSRRLEEIGDQVADMARPDDIAVADTGEFATIDPETWRSLVVPAPKPQETADAAQPEPAVVDAGSAGPADRAAPAGPESSAAQRADSPAADRAGDADLSGAADNPDLAADAPLTETPPQPVAEARHIQPPPRPARDTARTKPHPPGRPERSDRRLTILLREWSAGTPERWIMGRMNELPGRPFPMDAIGEEYLHAWARDLGLKRPDPIMPAGSIVEPERPLPPPTQASLPATAPPAPAAEPPITLASSARPTHRPRGQEANWAEIENWAAARGMTFDGDLLLINQFRERRKLAPFVLVEPFGKGSSPSSSVRAAAGA